MTNSRQIIQGLEKPNSAQEWGHMLKFCPEGDGWIVEHETLLARALTNPTVSQ